MSATIHLHYCINEFVGSSLWHGEKDSKCGKCRMTEKKGGCCNDEHKQLKLSADQNHNQFKTLVFEQFFSPVLLTPHYNNIFNDPATITVAFAKNNAPPKRWRNVPVYLSNCTFLI